MAQLVYKDFPQIGKGFRIMTRSIPPAGLIPVIQAAREGNRNEFRYSTDGGVTFTEWGELTPIGLRSMTSLTRKVDLVFDLITDPYRNIRARRAINPYNDPLSGVIYDKSVFKTFFNSNDPQVLAWALNVLEKLFEPGIIPLYVNRDNQIDFNTYFFTITHFFAFVVIYARQFREFMNFGEDNISERSREMLLKKFIEGWGLVYENITEEQQRYIFENWINEFRKRGTYQIVNKPEDSSIPYGELRRLVGYTEPNEFIFGTLSPQDVGWCMGWSSPTWTGTETVNAVSKGYDYGPDYGGDAFQDKIQFSEDTITLPNSNEIVENSLITNEEWQLFLGGNTPSGLNSSNFIGVGPLEDYPILGEVERKIIDNQYVLLPTGSGRVGVDSEVDKTKVMEVYMGLNYEITVWVKALQGDEQGRALPQNIEFGCNFYDGNKELRTQVRITDFRNTNSFFLGDRYQSPCLMAGVWYELRGIVYNIEELKDESLYLNFVNGRPLRFVDDAKYMAPYIVQNRNGAVSDIAIGGVVLKPLDLPFSQGYLGQKNVVAMYVQINSARTKQDIEDFIQRYLVSYKNVVSTTWLDWVVRTSYFVSFFVTNQYTGDPLEGATVTIRVKGGSTFSNVTDSNGYIRFEVPMDSEISYEVEYAGVAKSGTDVVNLDYKKISVQIQVPLVVDVTVVDPEWGTVDVQPQPTERLPRTEITLTATPERRYRFLQWEIEPAGAVDNRNPTVYQLGDVDIQVKAIFELNTHVIKYVAGLGISSVDPESEVVEHGLDAVGSTATVETGYVFDGWYDGDTRVSALQTYAPRNVMGDMTLTAKAVLKGELSFDKSEIVVPETGGSGKVTISSNKKWRLDPITEDWLTVSQMEGEAGDTTLTIEVK